MSDTAAETVTSATSQDTANSAASPSTSGPTSSQADTSTTTSASQPVAQPGSETPNPSPSSTTNTRSANTLPSGQPGSEVSGHPADAAPINWEQRFKDTQAAYTRITQQAKQYTEQLSKYQGIDPDKARHALSLAEKQAAEQKLKPWHPRHPEYAQTDARLSKARSYLTAISAARGTMEGPALNQYAQSLANQMGVRSDDLSLVNEYDSHVATQRDAFARDPDAYIGERVQSVVTAAIQQYEQYQSSRQYADRFMTDPANQPLIDKFGPDMLRAMDGGHQVAVEFARLKAENEALRAKAVQNAEPVHAAQAQQQALRDQATVRRDARTSGTAPTPAAGYEALRKEWQSKGLSGAQLYDAMVASKAALGLT